MRRDENAANQWLVLSRTRYRKGLGMKAPAMVVYAIDGRYATFLATVGIDDAARALKGNPTVVFRVLADGKQVFHSGTMTPKSAPKAVRLDVRGVKELQLEVADAGDGSQSDWADWADARFLVGKE